MTKKSNAVLATTLATLMTGCAHNNIRNETPVQRHCREEIERSNPIDVTEETMIGGGVGAVAGAVKSAVSNGSSTIKNIFGGGLIGAAGGAGYGYVKDKRDNDKAIRDCIKQNSGKNSYQHNDHHHDR